MFKKNVHFVDERHFGDQIVIYKGNIDQSKVYFAIIKDREEKVYYFIDSNLEKMYPVNSYVFSLGINFDFNNIPEYLDVSFDINLSKYGYTKCPDSISKLIIDIID